MASNWFGWDQRPAVLDDEAPTAAEGGDEGGLYEPDEFEHRGRIADQLSADRGAAFAPYSHPPELFRVYRPGSSKRSTRCVTATSVFVASPKVDSYESVWFELHEELIQLAGRSRAEETAAGRA